MLRHSRSDQGVKRTNSSMSRANHVAASQPACLPHWKCSQVIAGNSHSGNKIRNSFALKIAEVWRETPTHDSRETPMFFRRFQEGGKSDFVVKVKWQRYLGTSGQSIRDLELGTDQATLLCCPRLPPGFLWQQPYPIRHPCPTACAAAPGQPPAHSGCSQQGPVRHWGLAAKACFTQPHSGRRKSKSFRDVYFYFHPSSCLFLAKVYAALALAEDWWNVAFPSWRYAVLRAAGLSSAFSPCLTVNDLEKKTRGKVTLAALQLLGETGSLLELVPSLAVGGQ